MRPPSPTTTSPILLPPNPEALKIRASIEACLDPLSITQGRLSIPAEACLFTLLKQCFAKTKAIFSLPDPEQLLAHPSTLDRILDATCDTGSLPLVTETSGQMLAGLNDHDKSCLFLQAVAGIVLVVQHLSLAPSPVVTAQSLARELRTFAGCEQRRAALATIGGSCVFSASYNMSHVVDFVMAAIVEHKTLERLERRPTAEDYLMDVNTRFEQSRPYQNMGTPGGFTIMMLN